jgi:hypothetical protein
MRYIVLTLAAATAAFLASGDASARDDGRDRQYTVSYHADRGIYCIRFFSDSSIDPRPNNAAPNCMTRGQWAQQHVFIQHLGHAGLINSHGKLRQRPTDKLSPPPK